MRVLRGALLASVAAGAVFLNALSADFAFDDNFAILYNGDVTDAAKPLAALWRNDFWGQDIRGEGSHKSYRPLTVLSFRLNRVLSGSPSPLDARPFHTTNVALHAGVTAAVYALALRVAALRADAQPRTYAAVTALLFALHPIHTEAVTGVVGRAEMLSALPCICALLLFMACTDGCTATGSFVRFALTLLGALGCAAAAMLAKETGFTILGVFVAYELLALSLGPVVASPTAVLSPAPAPAPPPTPTSAAKQGGKAKTKLKQNVTAAAAAATPPATPMRTQRDTPPAAPSRPPRWSPLRCCIRLIATFGLAAAYLAARQAVIGGDTLVHIYRKVENPLAFYPSRTQRVLSTLHQHWSYASLLLVPVHMSADWSFSCIPPVESFADPRNAGTAALYGALAAAALASKPWRFRREERLRAARVRAFLAAALIVVPFLPAANVFFYVGTFIGERLLYFPSLGFCLLLAEPLAAACGGIASLEAPPAAQAPPPASKPQLLERIQRGAARLLLLALLCAYGGRTWLRNADWADEGTLFLAALRVCPDSAKVRLNNGILSRRSQDWPAALAHFRRAEAIEPGYCEPTYWIGLTLVNADRIDDGMALLVKALDCKWVAVEAAKALQMVIAARLKAQPTDTLALLAEADLLTRMEQPERACDSFTRAAASRGDEQQASATLRRCAASAVDPCTAVVNAYRLRHAEADAAAKRAARSQPQRSAADAADAAEVHRARLSALAREFVEEAGDQCRVRSRSYLEALNAMQRADGYDPWLHREWGRLLLARGGRDSESAQHLAVAVMLFSQAGEAAAAGRAMPSGPESVPSLGAAGHNAELWRREAALTLEGLPRAHREYIAQMLRSRAADHGSQRARDDDDDEL